MVESKLQPFTQFDWYEYSGCEGWSSGDPPWIARFATGEVIVVDRTGITIEGPGRRLLVVQAAGEERDALITAGIALSRLPRARQMLLIDRLGRAANGIAASRNELDELTARHFPGGAEGWDDFHPLFKLKHAMKVAALLNADGWLVTLRFSDSGTTVYAECRRAGRSVARMAATTEESICLAGLECRGISAELA